MTQRGFPLANQDVSVAEWEAMARRWLTNGVFKNYLNDLELYADSTGRQVKVKAGGAFLEGHYYDSSAVEILALAANSSGNPRRDLVVLRLDSTVDPTTLVLAVVTGTPAASPGTPSVTSTSTVKELALGYATVADGATTIAAGDVVRIKTWARPWGQNVAGKVGNSTNTFTGVGIASSAHPADGRYTVVYDEAVDANAAIIAVAETGSALIATVYQNSTTGCEIRVYNTSGVLTDATWVAFSVRRGDV